MKRPANIKLPVYLDNNATTPLDPAVFEAMRPSMLEHFGNPASATHSYGWYAEELVKIAREQVAELLNAEPEEIIFTSGATESNNLAIKGVAYPYLQKNASCHIVSAKTEHSAVLDPLERLRQENAEITLLDVNEQGLLEKASLAAALQENTRLVSIMLANNEIGSIHDIAASAATCKERGIFFHCDATQAIGKIPVDVKELGIELLSLSGHKIYGPKGVGALFVCQSSIKSGSSSKLTPLFHGGNHELGLRSGTLNVPGIVGLGVACRLAKERQQDDATQLEQLSDLLIARIKEKFSEVSFNGPEENRLPGNLNIAFAGVRADRLIARVNSKLAFSASSACTSQQGKVSHVLQALALPEERLKSSIRLGIGRFNTQEEIEYAAEILADAAISLRS